MISFKDFEGADGFIDWKAYRQAQVAAGEACSFCGAAIMSSERREAAPQKCGQCRWLAQAGSVAHDRLVRCPACGDSGRVADVEDNTLYEDGDHEVQCAHCEATYTVTTRVSHAFYSPARLAPPTEEAKDGEEG